MIAEYKDFRKRTQYVCASHGISRTDTLRTSLAEGRCSYMAVASRTQNLELKTLALSGLSMAKDEEDI